MGAWEKGFGLVGAVTATTMAGWLGYSGWWGGQGGWSACLGGFLSGLLLVLALALIVSAIRTLRRVQRIASRPITVVCPETGEYELVEIDPRRAVEAVCTGVPHRVVSCTRWEQGFECTGLCAASIDILGSGKVYAKEPRQVGLHEHGGVLAPLTAVRARELQLHATMNSNLPSAQPPAELQPQHGTNHRSFAQAL